MIDEEKANIKRYCQSVVTHFEVARAPRLCEFMAKMAMPPQNASLPADRTGKNPGRRAIRPLWKPRSAPS
jgi:hypothetical protein